MREIAIIMVSGAMGTLCRFGVGRFATHVIAKPFPFGTLIVNVLGCFVFGLVMQLGANSPLLSRTVRLAVTVGFLGAFTTFSTFGFETFQFLKEGQWVPALANGMANMALGLLAVWCGVFVARSLALG